MPLILAGAYIPIRPLGKGGFGATYLAINRYLPTMEYCVVKHFRPEGMDAEEVAMAKRLFDREARVLQQVGNEHDCIPDLYAYFPLAVPKMGNSQRMQEHFYLVQEYIDGEDLEQELRRLGPYDEQKIIELLKALLPILDFVHGRNIIHRDIKPANIMRHRHTGKIYLLDFGAVRDVFAGSKWTTIGTVGYAAPEQYHGGEVYPSTDLYGLGVTCLRLLTGLPPEELYDAYRGTWQWRDKVRVSPELAQILDRMVRPVVQERFPSAQAVLERLNQMPRKVQLPPHSKPLRPTTPQSTAIPQPSGRPAAQALPRVTPPTWVELGQAFWLGAEIGLGVMAAGVHGGIAPGLSLLLGLLLWGWVWFWGRSWLPVWGLAGLWVVTLLVFAVFQRQALLRLAIGSLLLGLILTGMVALLQWLWRSLR
ncbi:MAG: serine/threonine-protein kinase [Gloeomargarita sp. SKYBB_i_bin120]|nr:serine/threonine protein kinase [Gloeomargarita sp. SKYG98]MCS7291750.1 serine/threonine protein kinase [Gloeomargarita sp. SKYB120]MDW8177310.1 serine/threonine-protein kinase [Gloeomargarita sp. SKYBB_i_bin120]